MEVLNRSMQCIGGMETKGKTTWMKERIVCKEGDVSPYKRLNVSD
jgi:hypothetical protein